MTNEEKIDKHLKMKLLTTEYFESEEYEEHWERMIVFARRLGRSMTYNDYNTAISESRELTKKRLEDIAKKYSLNFSDLW